MIGSDNIFIRPFYFFILLLVLHACAKPVPPSGGDKDVTSPKILESYPLNGSTNYRDKKIELEFDEYVVSQSLVNEMIVSPPLTEDATVKMKGKKVIISWPDSLTKNVTYLFQFGDGIKDLNENNSLDSNVFVLSTGDYVDSLSQHGKVIDAYTLKPIEEAFVMLYKEDIDSLPKTRVPDYFTKTNKEGFYTFSYLAPGAYKAFVLKPVNKGYTFDLPTEMVAFSDTLVNSVFLADSVSANFESTVFKLFRKNDTTQYLRQNGQIVNKGIYLSFNKPVTQLTVTALDSTDVASWKETWGADNDSVVYWFKSARDYDSLKLEVAFDGILDTVFFRKPPKPLVGGKARKNKSESESLKIEKGFGNSMLLGYGSSLVIETPLDSTKLENVMMYHGKDTIAFEQYLERETFGFKMNYSFEEGETYDVYFPKGSVSDLYGLKNDSLHVKFTVLKDADLGEMIVNYNFPKEGNYIWELLDKDGKWVETFFVGKEGTVTHKNLPPGNYQIRLIFDRNGNQRWDSGDYDLKQQPERLLFHDGTIEVRANWISEIDWIIEK